MAKHPATPTNRVGKEDYKKAIRLMTTKKLISGWLKRKGLDDEINNVWLQELLNRGVSEEMLRGQVDYRESVYT